jgi:hypothetical protein
LNHEEIGFNAWILIGNVLNTILRAAPVLMEGADQDRLQQIDQTLRSIHPPQMLAALNGLQPADRQLLLRACLHAFHGAGSEAQTTLGLDWETAQPVIALLRESEAQG